MDEHTFVISGYFLLDDARATERAADLAERLVEEVSRAAHSWRKIEAMASSLAQLAAAMVKLAAAPPRPPPAR
jgi:hypothetical protein